ncbi:hypothetical protein [Rhizohabitans arisaemae]|uniref:hypothetical protein n=1 Tax=Rhizohabitans arisaemae TaxID=2720610 RepID=UPI0024B240C7|nr:hypothetical protein [Rhizohabitans arisaemae]
MGTGRLPLFCLFIGMIVTFLVTRVIVRLIRANMGGMFRNVKLGDLHVHHVVFGVVLMMTSGVAAFIIDDRFSVFYTVAATLFGVGTALVLDEFALILHLRDVYWSEEGRASVDAMFVAVAVTGLLLLGLRPLGWEGVHDIGGLDPATVSVARWIAVVLIVVNLVLAVVTLSKGKIWTGLVGLFVFPLLFVGAIRLARPGSPWAHWFFTPGSRKAVRALHREERHRRPVVRAKIAFQEFISGRHDLPSPLRRRDHHAPRKPPAAQGEPDDRSSAPRRRGQG